MKPKVAPVAGAQNDNAELLKRLLADNAVAFCVVNNQADAELIRKSIEELGMTFEKLPDAKTFLVKLKQVSPALCVLDKDIGASRGGLLLVQAIRHVLGNALPLVVILPGDDKSAQEELEKLGALPISQPLEPAAFKASLTAELIKPRKRGITYKLPPVLAHALEKIVPTLVELGGNLESFDTPEKRVRFYCNALEPYNDKFMTFFNATKNNQEKMKLESAIRVLGVNHVRDLLLSIKIMELVDPEKGFQWDPNTGKPKVQPVQIVKYARKTLLRFGEDSRYKFVSYSSGLVFDVLAALNSKSTENKGKIDALIGSLHEDSLKSAEAAYSLIKTGTGTALEVYIVVASLMKNAGKIAMAISEPTYLELLRKCENKKIPASFQVLAERKSYNLDHNTLGAILCQSFPGQGKAFLSTLFFDTPFFLKDEENKPRFDLVSICRQGILKAFPPPMPKAKA